MPDIQKSAWARLKTRLSRLLQGDTGMKNADDRMAWVRAQLRAVPAGWRLLDAGAGERIYQADCAHLKYVSQDFAQYDGQGDGRGLQPGKWDQQGLDIVSDITAIPEPDASFDAILCSEVLEHLPHPELALKEFGRLLRPGGRLIVSAPFGSLTHFAPYHFSTGFNRYYYEKLLPECGFKVTEVTPHGTFFLVFAQELRRLPEAVKLYTGRRIGVLTRILTVCMVRMMARYAKQDQGSQELQAFGYFVVAERLDGPQPGVKA
jgi:SAM-dependent methyltransferase